MLKLLNTFLVGAVLVAGFVLYTLEHQTRRAERELAAIAAAIKNERESIRLLGAEWSNLTRPERLQALAEEHLQMKPLSQLQLIQEAEIANRVPAEPIVKLEEDGKDPIGDILKKME
jgi:cell division protein FtsL